MFVRRALFAIGTATIGIVGLPVPSHAAVTTAGITINATPEPVTAGSYVTIKGRVGPGSAGNAGTVRVYFKKRTSSTYVWKATIKSTNAGYYSARSKQDTTGTWKAVFAGNHYRTSAFATDYVQAKAWRNVPVVRADYTGVGDYTGPVMNWSTTVAAKVNVAVSCDSAVAPFLTVRWYGHPVWSFDSAWFEPSAGATVFYGSSYIYPDKPTGYLEIATQSDCVWHVIVTQGTARQFVQVG